MFPIIAILLAAAGADAPSAEVRLRAQVTCSTSVVRLLDVAEVISSDHRLAQALADVPLCPAPTVGSERTLTRHDVRQLLALSGAELTQCRMTGSELVTITPAAPNKGGAAVRPIVAAGVRQAVFTDSDDPRTSVRPAAASAAPAVPPKQTAAMPLVERGTQVTVVARAAGIRITASGKALEAGAEDDLVNVELADTKQRILGRVSGPQTVEMTAAGMTATSN
jgi:flagella basal body P-ring formation protein FlgA